MAERKPIQTRTYYRLNGTKTVWHENPNCHYLNNSCYYQRGEYDTINLPISKLPGPRKDMCRYCSSQATH